MQQGDARSRIKIWQREGGSPKYIGTSQSEFPTTATFTGEF